MKVLQLLEGRIWRRDFAVRGTGSLWEQRGARATAVVRQPAMPAAIRALDVPPSDYFDLFVATTEDAELLSAEEWSRLALEESSELGRFVAWRVLLGLRLGPERSPDHVAGWRIVDNDPRAIRIEASSRFMTANIVFHVEPLQVSFATLIRYDNPGAPLVWTAVSVIHRKIAPEILRSAVTRLDRRR